MGKYIESDPNIFSGNLYFPKSRNDADLRCVVATDQSVADTLSAGYHRAPDVQYRREVTRRVDPPRVL